MPSKRFCFVVLAIVALLALATLTEAKGKFPKKQLHQARCGGTHDLYYHFLKRNPPLHAGIQSMPSIFVAFNDCLTVAVFPLFSLPGGHEKP